LLSLIRHFVLVRNFCIVISFRFLVVHIWAFEQERILKTNPKKEKTVI